MPIYVVVNESNEEVSSFTDLQHARELAEQLEYEFSQHYSVEELDWEMTKEEI